MNTQKVRVAAIAAMAENRVIGQNNALPWNIPEDMKHFVQLTKGHTVLMGRKTFFSAPMNGRPLPKRLNVIVTRSPEEYPAQDGVRFISDPLAFIQAIKCGEETLPSDLLWVIGGEQIYRTTMPLWDEVELTRIPRPYDGDTYFPEFEVDFNLVSNEDIGPCQFLTYRRK